jgi:hypothetical protein
LLKRKKIEIQKASDSESGYGQGLLFFPHIVIILQINLLREFSVPLIAGVAASLIWANYAPEHYHHFLHDRFLDTISFHFMANDIFMVFFFGIAAVEITQSFLPGGDLHLSSLGGMFTAGKTGLKAAMHHAPIMAGKERYVFYALPHIAIDAEGKIGVCRRRCREGDSTACGALNAFRKKIMIKEVSVSVNSVRDNKTKNKPTPTLITDTLDNDDIEMSLIRMRLSREMPSEHIPDLLELTKIAVKVILRDFEHSFKQSLTIQKTIMLK